MNSSNEHLDPETINLWESRTLDARQLSELEDRPRGTVHTEGREGELEKAEEVALKGGKESIILKNLHILYVYNCSV